MGRMLREDRDFWAPGSRKWGLLGFYILLSPLMLLSMSLVVFPNFKLASSSIQCFSMMCFNILKFELLKNT